MSFSERLTTTYSNISDFDITEYEYLKEEKLVGRKVKYINHPFAFDIETSSFFEGEEKRGCMYCWTFGIDGSVVFGRTWDEFTDLIHTLEHYFCLDEEHRLIIYVHNLSFDFQFFRKWLEFDKVFAIDSRQPCYAITKGGVEFRCSYLLSGYSLANLGRNLKKYKVRKMVGDLDYRLVRTSKTPMTDKEIKYACNDVRVVMAHIQEEIEHNGNITKIPLTKTGYVRKFCRSICLRKNVYGKYRRIVNRITIDADEYKQLKRAFQGGFTHASAWRTGRVYRHVHSFDFTSSYPAVMVLEQFPMSKGELIHIDSVEELRRNLRLYCCVFDICFIGLESKTEVEHPLSSSRCYRLEGATYDNGRVVRADMLATTLTDVDMQYLGKFYTWEHMKVANFRRYIRGYLPTKFVECILSLYHDKTTLKGVEGEEVNYQKSKEMLNSCYGMTVTDILRKVYTYVNDEWGEETDEEGLEKYMKSKTRFLAYQWGVFVTAYARRNLFSGIYSLGTDYIYSDTDSVKFLNYDNHTEYFKKYNNIISEKITSAMKYHGFSEELCYPKTIKGKVKMLGAWDDEGEYEAFKTLGAKRYMYRQYGETYITIAGLSKSSGKEYLKRTYGSIACFEHFDDNMVIPADSSGRLVHSYIDDETKGYVYDYLGNVGEYHELSSIHLEPSSYELSISEVYKKYLQEVKIYNE